jgi:hypothetical protein
LKVIKQERTNAAVHARQNMRINNRSRRDLFDGWLASQAEKLSRTAGKSNLTSCISLLPSS